MHPIFSLYHRFNKKSIVFGVFGVFLGFLAQFFSENAAFALDNGVEIARSSSSSSNQTLNVDNFYFEDFTADYYLEQTDDGASKLRVVEQFTAVFPSYNQNHGFNRIIPYTNQGGENLTTESPRHLKIKVARNGQEEPVNNITAQDGYFTVQIGHKDKYVTGRQKYVLEYEYVNVITNESEYDGYYYDDQYHLTSSIEEQGRRWQELYWDTNGTDMRQRVDQLEARVHLVGKVADYYTGQHWCYVGKYGDRGGSYRCQTEEIQDGIKFTTSDLARGENLSFDLEFGPDSFIVPEKSADYTLVIVAVVAGVWVIVVAILLSRNYAKVKAKRKFYKGYFIKPEYTPIKDVTVAEMIRNHVSGASGDSQVATLLELAVARKIEIIDTKPEGSKKRQWKLKLKSLEMTTEQRKVLEILAGAEHLSLDQEITLKRIKDQTLAMKLARDIKEGIVKKLELKGYFERSNGRMGLTLATVAALVLGSFGIMYFTIHSMDVVEVTYYEIVGGIFLAIGLIFTVILTDIVAFIILVNLNSYITHTQKGLELSRYMDGLKLYISMAEAERLKMLQSVDGADVSHQGIVNVYEKLLPYAIAFRMEKSWLKEMSKYYEYNDVSQPNWYLGAAIFSATDFSNNLAAMSRTTHDNFVHATASSSSSGFSGGGGGGFSGGGGGGGGTSGW